MISISRPTADNTSNFKNSAGDQSIKDKLKSEWKNIYRQINANDVEQSGKVKINDFNKALR